MINLAFAPNENFTSAGVAALQLLQPFNYFNPEPLKKTKGYLSNITHLSANQIFLMLSARSALYLYLQSLNLQQGSEVVVQGFTCEAVVLPIIQLGLKPIYADIETVTYSLTLKELKAQVTKATKVVILQHTFGMTPLERDEILKWCEVQKLQVIEDLAHGFHPGIFTSSAQSQSVKLLSFGRSKLFSATHGGAIIIPDKRQAEIFESLYLQLKPPTKTLIFKALSYKVLTPLIRATYPWMVGKAIHKLCLMLGLFSTEISQQEKTGKYDSWLEKSFPGALAVCLNQDLANFQLALKKRLEIAESFNLNFKIKLNSEHLPVLRFPLQVDEPRALLNHLKAQNIILGDWYRQPVDPKGLDLSRVEYVVGSCPIAERVGQQIINLPLNITMNEAQTINQALKAHHVQFAVRN